MLSKYATTFLFAFKVLILILFVSSRSFLISANQPIAGSEFEMEEVKFSEDKEPEFLSWDWTKKKSKLLASGLGEGALGVVSVFLVGTLFFYGRLYARLDDCSKFGIDEAFIFSLCSIMALHDSYQHLRECFTGKKAFLMIYYGIKDYAMKEEPLTVEDEPVEESLQG